MTMATFAYLLCLIMPQILKKMLRKRVMGHQVALVQIGSKLLKKDFWGKSTNVTFVNLSCPIETTL